MVARRPLSVGRRVAFALLATLVVFAAAEGLLRGLGAVLSRGHGVVGDGSYAVWAFGDSYTFGVGADDPAREGYPAVVAAGLEASRGEPVRLVNHARPGLNSTRIVGRLEEELARVRAGEVGAPDLVLLLAGVNNTRWLGRSGRFCLDEGTPPRAPGFARDLRVFKLLRHGLLRGRPPRPADVACAAVADGFQHLDEGRPDRALERFDAALEALPSSRWARVGAGLATSRMGRHAAAADHFEAAGSLGPLSPALPLAHAYALRSAGRIGEARSRLEGMGTLDGDLHDAGLLLSGRLFHDEGRLLQAIAVLGPLLPTDGPGADLRGRLGILTPPGGLPSGGTAAFALDAIGWGLRGRGDLEGAEAAFRAAHAVGDPLHITPHLLGWSHLGLAAIGIASGVDDAEILEHLELARRDSSAAAAALGVEAVVRAARSCADAEGPAKAALAILPEEPIASRVLARCLDVDSLDPRDPRLLADLRSLPTPAVQQWFDPADTALLERDLRRAVDRIEEAGARPVLLTYPQPRAHDEIAEAVLALGRERGVTVVDPRDTFQAAHDAGRPWSDLLIPDGHPTTEGYSLVGHLVLRALGAATPNAANVPRDGSSRSEDPRPRPP